jgi:thiol-disulfide isomerase/thioredoxin
MIFDKKAIYLLKKYNAMKKIILPFLFLLLFSNNAKATQWMTSFEDAQKIAIATNKFILVDFWATWCGPCKRMDSESWSDPEVQTLMNSFVPLKIDIDIEKNISRKYSVRGIPYVFIMDPNGEIVFQQMSYMRKSEVIILLKKFSLNNNLLQRDYLSYNKEKTGDNALKIAEKYLDYSIYIDKNVRTNFLKLANVYLKKSKDLYKKEGTKNKESQRIDLLSEVYRNTIFNNTDKALKKIKNEFKEEEIEEKNIGLYNFLNFTLYNKTGDKDNAKLWYEKLKTNKDAKLFLMKSRKILTL